MKAIETVDDGRMYSDLAALREIARANDWAFCSVCNKPFKLRTFIGAPGKPWYSGHAGITIGPEESYCRRCVKGAYDYLRGDADSYRGKSYRNWAEIVIAWVTKGGCKTDDLPWMESTWFVEEIRKQSK
jgi:hypothetical protein